MADCEIAGCAARVWQRTMGRNLCGTHSVRLRKYGDPEAYHPKFRKKAAWIEAHVGHQGDDCLRWPFSVSGHGRGTVQFDHRNMSAPRAMCILAHGSPPRPRMHAAHSCGNGHLGCMNPRHLSWKTPAENESDKVAHGTLRRGTEINTNKLSEDDVRKIRGMIGRVKGADIARAYGITPAMVSRIKGGLAWRWLT